jgi:hypothetical protein
VAAQRKGGVTHTHGQWIMTRITVGNHTYRLTWQKTNFEQTQRHAAVFVVLCRVHAKHLSAYVTGQLIQAQGVIGRGCGLFSGHREGWQMRMILILNDFLGQSALCLLKYQPVSVKMKA